MWYNDVKYCLFVFTNFKTSGGQTKSEKIIETKKASPEAMY